MNKKSSKKENKLKSYTMTLRLLKEKTSFNKALRLGHGYTKKETKKGILYVIQSESVHPTWSEFLGDFIQSDLSSLTNQHCSAILFIDVPYINDEKNSRIMALTFGYGHNALEMSSFEKNFGLKVTLSAVKKTELISLDAATLDSTIFQKRIQASKKTNFSGFGINIERDLLRLAGGVPSDISFASMLIGKDSLTITSKTSPTNFLAKCSKALEFFYSNSYKQEFSFIDHITPVDNNQKNKLDSRLLNEINNMIKNNVNSNLHLIIPDIINPEVSHEISYYGTGFKKGTKHSFSSLDISDYISLLANNEELSPIKTIDVIKKNQFIYEIDNGIKNQKSKKKIYDCFVFEIKIDTSSNLPVGVYVLFSGNWYLVNTEYYNEIEKFYQKYLSKSPFLESTKMKNERELISELNNNPELLNLDQVKLNPTGINNASIEPCDFLSKKLQFIHLKDGESSGPISHLWNQGIVSSETYLSDSKFRKDLSLSISQRQKHFNKTGFDTLFPSCGSKVSSSDITIVFGIMRKPYEKSCVVGLPFFSKVSFRPVAQAIERMGYKVELHLIKKI